MKNKINIYPDQCLVNVTRDIPKDQIQSDTYSTIGSAMIEIMRESFGVGLSANQVGLPFNMCVIEVTKGDPKIMLNPRIVKKHGKPEKSLEGCLSLPWVSVKVPRYTSIDFEYEDVRGETVKETGTGLTAQVVQHEIDHLSGLTLLNRLSEFDRAKAKKKLNAWKRNNK